MISSFEIFIYTYAIPESKMSREEQMLDKIFHAFTESSGVEEVKRLVIEALAFTPPFDVMKKMNEGLDVVGKKYENGEFFLSELIMAGVMATEVTTILKPHLLARKYQSKGKVVIGTVKGDIHDIGKNIASMMLTSSGFDVEDIGVDVPVAKFVNAVRERKPNILGISCLLTIGMDEVTKVIVKLKEEGLKSEMKVLIGGRPLTSEFAATIGADGYAKDAVEGARIAEQLIGGQRDE